MLVAVQIGPQLIAGDRMLDRQPVLEPADP
jgi:hypothetical protein